MKKINLIKFKDRIAFSLIELMVSMVVISVIMAAFTPIITKRMKANTIAMKLGDSISATKCETWINSNCRVCLRKRCVLCNDDVKCSASEYLHVDDCTCHSCSEYNANCTSCSVSKCKACSGGYGYSSSAPYCTQCKIGTYSDGTTACRVPDDGWYTDSDGASAPKPCEEGSMCKNGIKTTCKNGSWSNAKSSSCNAKCDEGYYCQDGVKTVCPPGKWSDAGSSSCTISCPAGSACSNGNKTACPSGTYSEGGAGSCTNCSAGYACSSTGQKICSAGTYAAAGATSCTKCAAGTYNTTEGSSGCTACGDGYYCSGGSNRVACSTLGCGGCDAASGGCTTCAPGTYKNGTTCSACPELYYCPDGVNKAPCNEGFICDSIKGNKEPCKTGTYGTRDACVSCSEGCIRCKNADYCYQCSERYKEAIYTSDKKMCKPCNQGTDKQFESFINTGTGCRLCSDMIAKCATCSKGNGDLVKCDSCQDGYFYQNISGSPTCQKCPEYCTECALNNNGDVVCTKCENSAALKDVALFNRCKSNTFGVHDLYWSIRSPVVKRCFPDSISATSDIERYETTYYFGTFCKECDTKFRTQFIKSDSRGRYYCYKILSNVSERTVKNIEGAKSGGLGIEPMSAVFRFCKYPSTSKSTGFGTYYTNFRHDYESLIQIPLYYKENGSNVDVYYCEVVVSKTPGIGYCYSSSTGDMCNDSAGLETNRYSNRIKFIFYH